MIRRELGYVPRGGRCCGSGCGRKLIYKEPGEGKEWQVFYSMYGRDKDVLLCPDCYFKSRILEEERDRS